MSVRRNPAIARLLDGREAPPDQGRHTPITVFSCDAGSLDDDVAVTDGARRARVLVRDGDDVVGTVEVPVRLGRVRRADLADAIVTELIDRLVEIRVRALIERPLSGEGPEDLARRPPAPDPLDRPTITAVICTRDRPDDLARALEAVTRAEGLSEIIVVDNAPTSDATRRVVESFAGVRYVLEERPGLDRARNRGLAEAHGEVVAFTDDDAVVDPSWAIALADAFGDDPGVWAVTGLVVPLELETTAQRWFETQGGFGRGTRRSWHHVDLTDPTDLGGRFLGAGRFGTGANMAFRRTRLIGIGGFDPALDVGTPTGGGGDLNAMFEVLHHGGVLVYEPRAIVHHRHRREISELYRQMTGNGGVFAHVRSSTSFDERLRPAAMGLRRWYVGYFARRFLRSLAIPGEIPASHVLAEAIACLRADTGATYRTSLDVGHQFGETTFERPVALPGRPRIEAGEAVRHVDLASPVVALDDVCGYRHTRVYVAVDGSHVGRVAIHNGGRPISRARLLDEIANQVGTDIVASRTRTGPDGIHDVTLATVRRSLLGTIDDQETPEFPATSVSVVIATLDRPEDLHRCLAAVTTQRTRHTVEVVVVDNNPDSGLTAPVVARFPDVVAVDERRRGLSHARNAGIRAAVGTIIVATDDDVVVPSDWLERLTAHFSRDDVMAICGNVLPAELGEPSQIVFEDMEMLGKGDRPRVVGSEWFAESWRWPAATWELGATANAAFRREVFEDPAMGLFDEALGAGTPSGCSEDSYLLYRIVRAGHTVVYDPRCWISHRHRSTRSALDHQLRSYYRGAVAHQIATVHHDGDLRGVVHIARIVRRHARSALVTALRRSPHRRERTIELRGVLEGPWAYWTSRRRVPPGEELRRVATGTEERVFPPVRDR